MEKISWLELDQKAEDAVDEMLKNLDAENKKYKEEHPDVNSEPLVLGTCPQCNYNLSKYLTRRDLKKEFIKYLYKRYEITFTENNQ